MGGNYHECFDHPQKIIIASGSKCRSKMPRKHGMIFAVEIKEDTRGVIACGQCRKVMGFSLFSSGCGAGAMVGMVVPAVRCRENRAFKGRYKSYQCDIHFFPGTWGSFLTWS